VILLAQLLVSTSKSKNTNMSQEKSYKKMVAQAKALMAKGNLNAYIQELVKAEHVRSMQRAI
jgi:hypothetical protein